MFTTEDADVHPSSRASVQALTAPLSSKGLQGRRLLKRFLYSQMAMRQAVLIALGREQPLVPFTIEAEPPSVYWVFGLRPDVVEGLAERLGLPPGYRLVPIRCLAHDRPEHLLTLNVYRVSGLANGLRAEWSVYVDVGDGVPRYLVVGARSSQVSMDPVDVITPATEVGHRREGRTVRTRVVDGDGVFACALELPDPAALELVEAHHEWVGANDRIYWGNGVCDRTFYDAGMAAARQVDVTLAADAIEDTTGWGGLVDPEPRHVLVLCDPVELVISPWENLDRLSP